MEPYNVIIGISYFIISKISQVFSPRKKSTYIRWNSILSKQIYMVQCFCNFDIPRKVQTLGTYRKSAVISFITKSILLCMGDVLGI